MNDDFNKDKVLGRVKKMLNLAEDRGASEGERDNALRMAHATLAKYNLSMADANATSLTPDETRIQGKMELKEHPWMRTAANGVAKLFFCHLLVTSWGKARYTYYFIGKESNVFTVQEMVKYVFKSIDAEARRSAKARGEPGGGQYWRSFCKGAAHQVYRRCEEIQRAAEAVSGQAASNGTSLVLASLYKTEKEANQALVTSLFSKVKTQKSRERSTNWAGYAAGKEYGNKIGLHNQVGSKNDKQERLN